MQEAIFFQSRLLHLSITFWFAQLNSLKGEINQDSCASEEFLLQHDLVYVPTWKYKIIFNLNPNSSFWYMFVTQQRIRLLLWLLRKSNILSHNYVTNSYDTTGDRHMIFGNFFICFPRSLGIIVQKQNFTHIHIWW